MPWSKPLASASRFCTGTSATCRDWFRPGQAARILGRGRRTGHPAATRQMTGASGEQISDELVASAEHLRAHPVTLEFLAEELTATSDLSAAFAEARDDCRRPFLKTMLGDPRYLRRDNHRVIVIIHAALNYLAMRSRRSPISWDCASIRTQGGATCSTWRANWPGYRTNKGSETCRACAFSCASKRWRC